jgi:hypothetical protein
MSTLGETCQHGQLRRQCEICDLEEQLAAMTKERDEWKAKAEANERDALYASAGEYLRNRITRAFEAGWLALERRVEEAINGKKGNE